MPTILVTGATGKQGAGVVSSLQQAGATVHALTRDASSPAAQALASAGVRVFEGTFTPDSAGLAAAVAGCDGLFLNTMPQMTSATAEAEQARAVLAAAKSAGSVQHVVYSGVMNADWAEPANLAPEARDRLLPPGSPFDFYYRGKNDIEAAVRGGGFARWTILRPAMFMSNFFPGPMYPRLGRDGTIFTGLKRDMKLALIDPADVGKFAAKVFLDGDGETYAGRVIDVAAEEATVGEIGEVMAKAIGKPVKVITLEDWTDKEVAESKLPENWALMAHKVQVEQRDIMGPTAVAKLGPGMGIEMTTLEAFMQANKDKLLATVGPL